MNGLKTREEVRKMLLSVRDGKTDSVFFKKGEIPGRSTIREIFGEDLNGHVYRGHPSEANFSKAQTEFVVIFKCDNNNYLQEMYIFKKNLAKLPWVE